MKKNNEMYLIIFSIIIILLIIIVIIYKINSSNTILTDNNIKNNKNINNNVNIYKEQNNDILDNTETKTKETQIATFSSNIFDKDVNRGHNIKLAIEKLNNKIIKPNEVFSFNNTIGPMSEKNGFKKAIGFDSKGRNIKIAGGGLCQLSSTLYNSVLIANLEIIERHPHSKRVYYVPKDKDATIAYGSLDFKFRNNKTNDIKITGTSTESNVTINLIEIEKGS